MKIVFHLILIFSFILISCGKKKEVSYVIETDTLKSQTEMKIREVFWTDQLEPGRLENDISSKIGIAGTVRLSPMSVAASKNQNEMIYPSFSDFGSLDTSKIPSALLSLVEEFSDSIINGKNADSFMVKKSLFSLAFFYEELGDQKPKNYLIGEPFIGDENYEIPLRLYSDGFKIDLILFFVKAENTWKIDQIQTK